MIPAHRSIVISLLLLLSTCVFARTFFVAPSTHQQVYPPSTLASTCPDSTRENPCSLQAAVTEIQSSDASRHNNIIIMLPGNYYESHTFSGVFNLTLMSDAASTVTIGSPSADTRQYFGQPGFIFENSTVNLIGLSFQKFQTNAIIVSGATSSASFSNCVFQHILIDNDLFIQHQYIKFPGIAGLAIYSEAPIQIDNCVFTEISSSQGLRVAGMAVAVLFTSCDPLNISITNSRFTNILTNDQEALGGALYVSLPDTVCPRQRGTPEQDHSVVLIANSSFSEINLGDHPLVREDPTSFGPVGGGALALIGSLLDVYISDCIFDSIKIGAGTQQSSGMEARGGVILLQNTPRLLDMNVHVFSSLRVQNSTFTRNTATGGRSGTEKLLFYGSAGACSSAGIFIDGFIYTTIENSHFEHNLCIGGDGGVLGGDASGGAILINVPETDAIIPPYAIWNISSCTFLHNSVHGGLAYRKLIDRGGSRASGGAVYFFTALDPHPSVYIHNCTFFNNSAYGGSYGDSFGGGISFILGGINTRARSDSKTLISYSRFRNNTAASGLAKGGAIAWAGDATHATTGVEIVASDFLSNRALGGYEGSEREKTDYIAKSRSVAEGGAVWVLVLSLSGRARILSSSFINNTAQNEEWMRDGAYWIMGIGYAQGGAVRVDGSVSSSVTNSVFSGNSVLCVSGSTICYGGALACHMASIESSQFQRNFVLAQLPLELPPKVPQESIQVFPDTRPSLVQGGAVYADSALSAQSSDFLANFVNGSYAYGGALFTPRLSKAILCNITYNQANSSFGNAAGGAVYVQNNADAETAVVTGSSRYIGNTAHVIRSSDASFGGAIHAYTTRNDHYIDSIFLDNAADFGGALDIGQLYAVPISFDTEIFVNNTAYIAGGAIAINLNENIDQRILPSLTAGINALAKNITFDIQKISRMCNATQGNFAKLYGDFCALTIDQMILSRRPPSVVWPGQSFSSTLNFVDLRHAKVVSKNADVKIGAALGGIVHLFGDSTHNQSKSSFPINVQITKNAEIGVDAFGDYSFSELRLDLAPGSIVEVTYSAINGPGPMQGIFPSYVPTTNHSFADKIIVNISVAQCPPGFILRKSSDGRYDCSKCPPYTYTLDGESSECLPCPAADLALDCLVPPEVINNEKGKENEYWTIPQGYYPVPAFNETYAILSCPNKEACKRYQCALRSIGHLPHLNWTLDCFVCPEKHHQDEEDCSLCERGYTGRLCSRCECQEDDFENCFFAANGEEFVCRQCETPSTAALAGCGILIVLSLIGFLLFKHSAVAIFVAEVLIAILLLVLGLGEWWFFDVIVISTVLFLISRSATKRLTKIQRKRNNAIARALAAANADSENDVHAPSHDPAAASGHHDEHSAYFVGVIKVSLFFLQTTSAVLPPGSWPKWISHVLEALNSVSLRVSGLECFYPKLFSIPAVRFGVLMSAPIVIVFVMAVATVCATLLAKLAIVRRLQDLEAQVSIRASLRRLFTKCSSKKRSNPPPEAVENDDGSAEHEAAQERILESDDADVDVVEVSDAESEVEESLLLGQSRNSYEVARLQQQQERHEPASYWLRFQYSVLFIFFASQFELSNVIFAQLKPCEEGFMAASPWIACNWNLDAQYRSIVIQAFIFLVVYVIGIPALFLGLLMRNRKRILQGSEDVERRMGFLYETYKREFFFFEVIWLLRRVLLSLALALIPSSTGFKTPAIAFILLVFLFIQQTFKPFSSSAVNMLETLSSMTILLSFSAGTDILNTMSPFKVELQTLLWILNAVVVFVLIGSLVAPAIKRLATHCGTMRCCRSSRFIKMK